jgi:hypothetical protein
VGIKYNLGRHVLLESWANIPDEEAASFIGKINFVFNFKNCRSGGKSLSFVLVRISRGANHSK